MKLDQKGFSFVELMIATAVFGLLMVIASLGVIGLFKSSQKATANRRTQQNARKALETMIRDAREATGVKRYDDCDGQFRDILYLELPGGTVKYRLKDEAGVDKLFRIRVTEPMNNCPDALSQPEEAQEALTGGDVTVTQLDSSLQGSGTVSLGVGITVATVNQNLNASGDACLGGPGSQFCSVTKLESSASLRGVK